MIELGGVFRNQAFLSLWLAQLLSQVADKIYFVLMVDLVAARTNVNGAWTSIALVAYTLPSVFFGAIAGALVDRWDKVRTQIITNLARGSLIALVPFCGEHQAWPVVALSFLISVASQPYPPAESATIPLLVEERNLLDANSLFTTTTVGSIILGFTLGEPVIGWVDRLAGVWASQTRLPGEPGEHATAAWVIAGMYALAMAALLRVERHLGAKVHSRSAGGSAPPATTARAPAREKGSGSWTSVLNFYAEFRDGWSYIRSQRAVWGAIAKLMAVSGMFAALSTVAILFAKQTLKTSFSILLATAGIGMALGAVLVARFGRHLGRTAMTAAGFCVAGGALILLAFLGSTCTPLAYLLTGVIGTAAAWVIVPSQTQLQEVVPEELRGKVFGVSGMATNLATSLPMGAAGVLADLIGVRTLVAALGVAMLLAATPTALPRNS